MKNLTFAIAIITTLTSADATYSARAAEEAILKSAAIVEGRYITLGDLFENAGVRADTNVAYAPAPGKRAIFDARWLYRVARAHGGRRGGARG